MQNDLISRSALIEELKKCTCTDKHDERIIKDFVVHIIEKQPIVYDVKKVVAELEKYKSTIYSEAGECLEQYVYLDTAKKIVRKGGVE